MENNEKPTFFEKATNLGKAIWAEALNGFTPLPEEIISDRENICGQCEYVEKKDGEIHKCLKCGCYLQIKIRMATSKCPLENPKWNEV